MTATEALVFASEEALLVALTSELLAPSIMAQPVHFARSGDGTVWVRARKQLGQEARARLDAAGVKTRAASGLAFREARFWPAMVAPRRMAQAPDIAGASVIFLIGPDASQAAGGAPEPGPRPTTLVDLAAELIRLGCHRCAYQLHSGADGSIAAVRAHEPPYYTVAASGEPGASYRSFVPAMSGQSRVWIELGYEHPLASAVMPATGRICLISGAGEWIEMPDGPWRDIFSFIEIAMPPGAALTPVPPPHTLTVSLRLAAAIRGELPSLWVIRGADTGADAAAGATAGLGARAAAGGAARATASAIDRVDALVRVLPDDVIARLSFAVLVPPGGQKTGEVVVLRARHGRSGPPPIDVSGVSGVAMVPYMGLPNLYLPHDATVEPPLCQGTLRQLLAPDDERVFWLAPREPRGCEFRVESAPEHGFAPLAEWVEYLIDRSADELAPWVRSVTFEFESFRSSGREWADAAGQPAPEPGARGRGKAAKASEPAMEWTTAPSSLASRPPIELAEPELAPISATAPAGERPSAALEAELGELERTFLDLDAPADDPVRMPMWLSMARLHGRLGQHRDAALCLVRALWELPREASKAIVDEWAAAEVRAAGLDDVRELIWRPLRLRRPTENQVRAVAAGWIATVLSDVALQSPPRAESRSLARALGQVQRWFVEHDSALDVRTMWLVRWALAAHAGGDPLALARARDAALARMLGGLSMERDVPTFLRFLGSRSTGDTAAVARLAEALDILSELFDQTRRQRSVIEAPTHMTGAYVSLVIAYGFARLGRVERAHQLRQAAAERLDLEDPIHGFLFRAYSARVDQALEGAPPETPLPAAVVGMLASLRSMDRFKVDRLREASSILEPQQRIDATRGFLRASSAPGGDEIATLRLMSGDELGARVDELLATAVSETTATAERVRLMDGLMDVLPMLPGARALPPLLTIVAATSAISPPQRALLLEEALMVAGYFGRDELAGEIAGVLAGLVAHLGPAEAAELAPELGRGLRNLRRFGLHAQARELVDALSAVVLGEDVRGLEARLHVAAGLAALGDFAQAEPIIAGTQAALPSWEIKPIERMRLIRALAQAWSQCPREPALAGLSRLSAELAGVTDMLSTNSHFCLSIVAFMEALVLGYVMSDLSLGELGRRWLDEDEFLARRRIHRELGERS